MYIQRLPFLATLLAAVAALALTGCAGDLRAARNTAKQGAAFVGDMQKAISAQRDAQQASLAEVATLNTAAELDAASTNRHVATWQGDKSEDSQALFKALLAMTADADLQKTAPFVVMAPLPVFNTPAIDDKAFQDVIARFNKLSKGLSPMDRAAALIPFIQTAAKAYKNSAAETTSKAAPAGSTTGVDAALKQAADLAKVAPVAAASSPAAAPPADNTSLVNALTSALSVQP